MCEAEKNLAVQIYRACDNVMFIDYLWNYSVAGALQKILESPTCC